MEREDNPGTSVQERIDPYGFRRQDFQSYAHMMSSYGSVLTRRSLRWGELLRDTPHLQRNLTVKRFVRKGVPDQHRSRIWMTGSGAQDLLDQNPGYYQSLLNQEPETELKTAIDADMNRTFPDNVLFQGRDESSLQRALRRVLLAVGLHNPTVGYCQGMNFIVGYLIIITKDEELAFWLMNVLLKRILPDYYSPGMMGLKTDQEVLGELVKAKAPAVGQLMDQYPGIWTLVVSRWFICLYIDVLPIETVLRIWDCLFYEGSKVLFRVALTLVIHHQPEILRARSLPDVCDCFKSMTCGDFTLDCHAFMQKIFTEPGSLSMATVEKLRLRCRDKILEEESKQP